MWDGASGGGGPTNRSATGASGGYIAGIDVGGTFTDVLLLHEASGRTYIGKAATTPPPTSRGVEDALRQALADSGAGFADIHSIIHGTTLATNAIVERKGAKTALLTTRGFRDVLEIAREHRYDMYDIHLELPEPLVPRTLRLEVTERVLADGTVLIPLAKNELPSIAAHLREARVDALAICFLNSFTRIEHEEAAAETLSALVPGLDISISSDVSGEIREYERSSTTVLNAYIRRVVESYLQDLEGQLTKLGFAGRLLVMLSNGGVATVETASRYPVRMIESGPAAGALAAAFVGGLRQNPNLLSFDMGGTTAKACLVQQGRPSIASDFEVARIYRFKRGSGLPVKAPSVELIEIGAGGGSVAWIDQFNLLRVGPESAGAEPGPACYGRGGTRPTVTDADLVLGYLDPRYFLGGRMPLDAGAAERAIREVADPLRLSVVEAAWTIHQVVNENMTSAARIHGAERGADLRNIPMYAFGGAGPVHAYRVAELLEMKEVVLPHGAGVGSCLGLLVAPLAFDLSRSMPGFADTLDWLAIEDLLHSLESSGRRLLIGAAASDGYVEVARFGEMRLRGQAHALSIPLPPERLDLSIIRGLFSSAYQASYHRMPPDVPIEMTTWRVRVQQSRPPVRRAVSHQVGAPDKKERSVYWPEEGGYVSTPVFDRYRLRSGTRLSGPAIIEERESTAIVGPSGSAEIDAHLNMVLYVGRRDGHDA